MIEDLPMDSMEYDTKVEDEYVEKMETILHRADATFLVADETQVRDLVHIILRLQSQFKRHFPSDYDVYEWREFFSKHVTMLDAISWMLMPNVQNLVDFMNNNYADFINQFDIITKFTELYRNVFDANFDKK